MEEHELIGTRIFEFELSNDLEDSFESVEMSPFRGSSFLPGNSFPLPKFLGL